jgi:ribosomal protein L40E
MPPLRCLFCQHDNPAAARFCNECGTPLDLRPCTSCNAVDSRQATACYRCGTPFAPAPARSPASAEPGHVQAEPSPPAPANAAPLPGPREPALAKSWQPSGDAPDLTAFDPRGPDVPPVVIPPRAPLADIDDEDEGNGREVRWGVAAALAAIAVIAALALLVDREGRRVVTVSNNSSNATGSATGTDTGPVVASPPAPRPAEAPASAAAGADHAVPAGPATGDERLP